MDNTAEDKVIAEYLNNEVDGFKFIPNNAGSIAIWTELDTKFIGISFRDGNKLECGHRTFDISDPDFVKSFKRFLKKALNEL